MDGSSLLIRTVQVTGITASAVLSGTQLTFSVATIPALLLAPTQLLLQQWRTIFVIGRSIGPPLSLVAFLNLAFLSYTSYNSPNNTAKTNNNLPSSSWRGYAIAATATLSIIPYTLLVMGSTNSALIRESADSGVAAVLGASDVRALVTRWAWFNGARCTLPLLGAVVGFWTALK